MMSGSGRKEDMYRLVRLLLFVGLFICLSSTGVTAEPPSSMQGRFFHSGDGRIHLKRHNSQAVFQGRYRTGVDAYDPAAYEAICRVFGAPCGPNQTVSLRLIEFVDALEDHFNPGTAITITSGYRSPRYNTHLRQKGRLAAKASLHQYGMAADFKMAGVPARRIWEYVKELGFGGAGYYQGDTVHIDVGPARSWDQQSSGVGTGISDDNKLIGLVTRLDVYRGGESVRLRFIRMTAFPIGVEPRMTLYRQSGSVRQPVQRFLPVFGTSADGSCPRFGDIDQMADIRWNLPEQLPPGRYLISAGFCDAPWPDMPAQVFTPQFEVVAP